MAKHQKKKTAHTGKSEPAAPTGDPIFAENLRRVLESRGMPARELARQLTISPQAVGQWLSGQTGPSTRRVAQVARIFGLPVDRLRQDADVRSVLPIRQLEPALSVPNTTGSEPVLDEYLAKVGLWTIPREAIADDSGQPDVAVLKVTENILEPELRVGDYVFVDLTSHTVFEPGIYLLLIAKRPTWRRCHPLFGERVRVTDREMQQEVSSSDLAVLGRALWLLKRP